MHTQKRTKKTPKKCTHKKAPEKNTHKKTKKVQQKKAPKTKAPQKTVVGRQYFLSSVKPNHQKYLSLGLEQDFLKTMKTQT